MRYLHANTNTFTHTHWVSNSKLLKEDDLERFTMILYLQLIKLFDLIEVLNKASLTKPI